jgi:1-deoxy-D-xylulose-5-phosphate reductoisomerase
MKAQMGLPDMKLPILYAMSYPGRIRSEFPRFDFLKYPKLSFELPDRELFRNLELAYIALRKCGNTTCVLNAANEAAVAAFLEKRISFLQMSSLIEYCLEYIVYINKPTYDDLVATHQETLILAEEQIMKLTNS